MQTETLETLQQTYILGDVLFTDFVLSTCEAECFIISVDFVSVCLSVRQ